MYNITDTNSSLISEVEYDEEYEILTVKFKKYYIDEISYKEVPLEYFMAMSSAKSLGKFYLSMIKNNFKQFKPSKMAEKQKPATQNEASDTNRYIDISIDVKKIKREWIFAGEKGDWLHLSLRMLPNGEIDAYGNLGMVTQKVPKEVYEKEVKLPKEAKTKGPILGNACEFARKSQEGAPGEEVGRMGGASADDLPF